MIGYWAEARILGGVVLFDRRTPDDKPASSLDLDDEELSYLLPPKLDPDAIYFHSDREHVTYRIYQLLPEQKQALVDFLTADPRPLTCPLPILGDDNNLPRVDPEEPLKATGIYRDIWERKDRPFERSDARLRDVWDTNDFPTRDDKGAAANRAMEMRFQAEYGDFDIDPEF